MSDVIGHFLDMSGGDGDYIKGGIATPPEMDQLFAAWSLERGRSIEGSLLMGRVRRLLARIVAAGRLAGRDEREAKGLLRLIDSLGGDDPAIER